MDCNKAFETWDQQKFSFLSRPLFQRSRKSSYLSFNVFASGLNIAGLIGHDIGLDRQLLPESKLTVMKVHERQPCQGSSFE